jgi:predicted transcriptional regulator of viral defense system
MTYAELQTSINSPYFYTYQLKRLYPSETQAQINTQLWRWTNQNKLIRLKKSLYVFTQEKEQLNDFLVSNLIYQPSYVSLESALNSYGIIPDVTAETTAVNPITTKNFKTELGQFSYHKLKSNLFFGYRWAGLKGSHHQYRIAEPEKALLDFIYVRQMSDMGGTRISWQDLNTSRLYQLAQTFPDWVRQAVLKEQAKNE